MLAPHGRTAASRARMFGAAADLPKRDSRRVVLSLDAMEDRNAPGNLQAAFDLPAGEAAGDLPPAAANIGVTVTPVGDSVPVSLASLPPATPDAGAAPVAAPAPAADGGMGESWLDEDTLWGTGPGTVPFVKNLAADATKPDAPGADGVSGPGPVGPAGGGESGGGPKSDAAFTVTSGAGFSPQVTAASGSGTGTSPPPPPPTSSSGTFLVGDRVWDDANVNGIQDPGEPGVPGVRVELFSDGGTYLTDTTSLNDGSYRLQWGGDGSQRFYIQIDPNYADTGSGTGPGAYGAPYYPVTFTHAPGSTDANDNDIYAASGKSDVFGMGPPIPWVGGVYYQVGHKDVGLAIQAAKIRIDAKDPLNMSNDPAQNRFNDTTKLDPGGLVVRHTTGGDDNLAPRQKIVIDPIIDTVIAPNKPAADGSLTFTYGTKVKVYDALVGGNLVPSPKVYKQAELPKILYVEGVEGSAKMRDTEINVKPILPAPAAGTPDLVKYTVLWVDVDVSLSGRVSPNNSKLQTYKDITYDITNKMLPNKILPHGQVSVTDVLGPHGTIPAVGARIGWGLEGRGAVSPSDFFYPGSDLHLAQDVEEYRYAAPPGGASVGGLTKKYSTDLPLAPQGGNDTANPVFRDDDPRDSNGFIYYIDLPGLATDPNSNQGVIQRARQNFKALAVITIDGILVRPSGILGFFVRLSIIKTVPPGPAGTKGYDGWDLLDPPDVAGDNDAKKLFQTPTTWNLT